MEEDQGHEEVAPVRLQRKPKKSAKKVIKKATEVHESEVPVKEQTKKSKTSKSKSK
jgi:hypothetical protein